MIDFHTHVLHCIDDGSDDLDVSVKMLEKAYRRGTDVAVITPHCYPADQETLDKFLKIRQLRFNELVDACRGKQIPKLRLAAEVNVCSMFTKLENIHDLCIDGTDYMLVELPPGPWNNWMLECIYNLTLKGIKPIIAHIERYVNYPENLLDSLCEINPVFQVNAEAFLSSRGRKTVLDFFARGMIHILGSDTHNGQVKRKNTLCDAYIRLEECYGPPYLGFIRYNGGCILDNTPVSRERLTTKTLRHKLFF